MADTRTQEQIEADWWDAWWKADYSWDGLAKKPLEGWVVADGLLREAQTGRVYGQPAPETPAPVTGASATIQDYWCADPATGRLRAPEDMKDELISEPGQPVFHRIHLPLAFKDGTPTGKADWADNALDGLIGPRLIAATETVWEDEGYRRQITGADGRASLGGAVLLAGFAHPNGNANSLSFRCEQSAFVRKASFDNATFSGDASFDRAIFWGDARFNSTTFSGDASFDRATFSGIADFDSVAISGEASFFSGTFSRVANFGSATISGNARFVSVIFSEYASFLFATFSGNARFDRATFPGDSNFYSATFSGDARFDSATFSGDAHFNNARFGTRFSFRGVTFSRNALFIGTMVEGQESAWRGALSGCLFERLVDWTGAPRLPVAAFSGARLDRGILLSRASDGEDKAAHKAALDDAANPRDGHRQAALKALEGGALQIKLALEQASDRLREQRFYRLELLARRKQSGTPWTEKFCSHAYGVVSNYGASIGWPVVHIFAMMLAFTMGFFLWAGHLNPFSIPRDCDPADASSSLLSPWPCPVSIKPEIWQALDLSWSNTFKPLSALSTENDFEEKNPLAFDLLYDEAGRVDGQGFAVRAVSSLQSILALLLAFLIALAIRRRFQIS